MYCIHLRLKAEYWNFGKESSEKTSLKKLIERANGKIMVDDDYPDQCVVAVNTKKDFNELKNLVGGFYIISDMTNNLTNEGHKLMRDKLNL